MSHLAKKINKVCTSTGGDENLTMLLSFGHFTAINARLTVVHWSIWSKFFRKLKKKPIISFLWKKYRLFNQQFQTASINHLLSSPHFHWDLSISLSLSLFYIWSWNNNYNCHHSTFKWHIHSSYLWEFVE